MSVATACPAPAPKRRWHKQFLALLPQIVTHARIAFRHVRGQDRHDKIQEVVANALVAFRRLVQLNKAQLAYPSVLAKYAAAQINDGRMVGGKMNCRDVSSLYCQRVIVVGCSKQQPEPHKIHWHAPESGFSADSPPPNRELKESP